MTTIVSQATANQKKTCSQHENGPQQPPLSPPSFRAVDGKDATCLTDGVQLNDLDDGSVVVIPWVGFGTYRLGKASAAETATLQALRCGYRGIDTAFIYGGERTERSVGVAIQTAVEQGIIQQRSDIFLTTKHWRKYHGYDATLDCLTLSLKRLQVDYVDLYLMHWPGPAWKTMSRKRELVEQDRWHYAATDANAMARTRAETWRAMEEGKRKGLCRSIGVSNFSIHHLETLKKTATIWPPAVNQVEFHPLHPQTELLAYCKQEGIVLQAYASLGGQDTGKKKWSQLLGPTVASNTGKKHKDKVSTSLLSCDPVVQLAAKLSTRFGFTVTPAQVLLRWGLQHGVGLIPLSTSKERLLENARLFSLSLSSEEAQTLQADLRAAVVRNNPDARVNEITRLCWRSDPLRHLDFD